MSMGGHVHELFVFDGVIVDYGNGFLSLVNVEMGEWGLKLLVGG